MVQSKIVYSGDLCCNAFHGPSGSVINTDAPVDNKGLGRFFSPTDLLTVSVASCIATIMGIKAQELGINIENMEITADKVMNTGPVRKISEINLKICMPVFLKGKEKIIMEKVPASCPVSKSLHPELKLNISFIWPANN
jgi:putative redox protein